MIETVPQQVWDPSRFDGRRFVRFAVGRWWVVVCFVLLGGASALVVSMVQTPIYAASSTLYVTSGAQSDTQTAYQGNLASQQRVASYVSLIESDSVLERAISSESLGLTVDEARSMVSASAVPETVLISIRAESADPGLARRLVGGLSDAIVVGVADLERPAAGGPPLARLSVVSPATVEPSPVSPHVARSVLIGGAIGLALAVAVLLLVSRFDVVIRSSEDLVARGDSSILGSVPVAADADIELLPSRGMAFLQSSFWESFRSIRTNLTFVRVDSPPKRLVVTSAVENEGKTTTAIALATVLAEGGHSVLLVDADLRRPSVSTRLGLTSDVGLTDCLSGSVPLDSAVQSSTLPGLSIVSSGRTPPNPAELLASDRAAAVFSDFGSRFDFVIVDSPPVLRVTDAVVMARSVGCVLMVARAGVSRLPEYSRAVSELNLVGGDIIGAILNGCDRASSRYSYGYGVTHS